MRHFTKSLIILLILFFSSCSEDSIQEISAEDPNSASGNFLKDNELLTSNFLPTFTNYYGRDHGTATNRSSSVASEWIHEYDEKNRLVKSSFFELYPYRILKEITYLDFGDVNTLKYDMKEYSHYGVPFVFHNNYELTFDNNLNILTIGDAGTVLSEFSAEGWVTKINTVSPDGNLVYQTGYEYDEKGNILKYISYDTPGVGSASVDYTYNENGDPLSYYFQNSRGAETTALYYYRDDNTLERLEEEFLYDNGEFGTKIFNYSLDERYLKLVFNYGDGSRERATYSENEIIVEHFQNDDNLSEVYIFQVHENNYFLKIHKEYVDGVISIIRYYIAEGKLEYTEYYDENGNLTETVYE